MPAPIAVVPVAGLGTRLLPATKSQPKEMLPLAGKPIVQHVVEEVGRAGVDTVVFVTGRGKGAIEDHFDPDPELIRLLRESGREELLERLEYERSAVAFAYVRQHERRGLGDAILRAEPVVGEAAFVVALGDTIITGEAGADPLVSRMRAAIEAGADCAVAVEPVPRERLDRYGVVEPAGSTDGGVIELAGLVEKPDPDRAPSNLAVAARYLLPATIFELLRATPPSARGEVEITDAIASLARDGARVVAVPLGPGEHRLDIGTPESYLLAQVELALADREAGAGIRERLRELLEDDGERAR